MKLEWLMSSLGLSFYVLDISANAFCSSYPASLYNPNMIWACWINIFFLSLFFNAFLKQRINFTGFSLKDYWAFQIEVDK